MFSPISPSIIKLRRLRWQPHPIPKINFFLPAFYAAYRSVQKQNAGAQLPSPWQPRPDRHRAQRFMHLRRTAAHMRFFQPTKADRVLLHPRVSAQVRGRNQFSVHRLFFAGAHPRPIQLPRFPLEARNNFRRASDDPVFADSELRPAEKAVPVRRLGAGRDARLSYHCKQTQIARADGRGWASLLQKVPHSPVWQQCCLHDSRLEGVPTTDGRTDNQRFWIGQSIGPNPYGRPLLAEPTLSVFISFFARVNVEDFTENSSLHVPQVLLKLDFLIMRRRRRRREQRILPQIVIEGLFH